MKALVYLGPGRMEPQEVPDPEPMPGEVVIETAGAAICGSDLHAFREASSRRIPPLIMGHETVGTVAEVGAGVDPARVGQRVVLKPLLSCGRCDPCRAGRTNLCAEGRLVGRDLAGGFAERFAVPEAAAVPIAGAVPDVIATLTEPLANAVHVASRAVDEGDEVLVIGAGPIGVLMARMALLEGARHVFTVDRIAVRLELARRQGATPLEPTDNERSLRDATSGRGADVVIDAVGVEETWALALRSVRPAGRFEVVGLGAPGGTVDFFGVIGKEARITGSFACTDDDFARAVDLIGSGAIDATGWVTTASFAEGQRAFQELTGPTDRFKVVLVP
jgi:2-desacetyl-2-hydroxyethyl bacteriochlorophyllide A dehydrogenase